MSESEIRSIPLSQLELSPANVRTAPAGKAADAELKASIAAHGLLENLVARCFGPGPDGVGRYAVIAGGRRLAALRDLARDGAIGEDFPVPCRITDNAAEEKELSLAENTVRVAMHPADQVRAFAALADAGSGTADIATRFGVSERTVAQRLRLGNAAPEILDAYRDGGIGMDVLTAFALTADRERQTAVWNEIREQPHRPSVWQITHRLTEGHVRATGSIARFVTVEAYEAAGGKVIRDLFADEDGDGVWLDDPELLRRLAMDKLEAAAGDIRRRWKWAEAQLDLDYMATARYGHVNPEPGEPTEEERAEVERLHARHDEIASMDEDAWTDELIAEGEAIEEHLGELNAIVDTRATYGPEHRAAAGCIVTLKHGGELRLVEGLVRPEDMPTAAGTLGRNAGEDDRGDVPDSAPAIEPPRAGPTNPEAEARGKAGLGIGLADDLRAVRTGDVKSHLAGVFEDAFDLILFQLARAVFANGYHAGALDIAVRATIDQPLVRGSNDGFPEFDDRERQMDEDRASLPLAWMREEDDGAAFGKLCALSEFEKRRLFASCVARTVNGQLAFEPKARPELEAVIARLEIGFAASFRPTAAMFWSRIRKDRILEIARATLGPAWAQARAKRKKTQLAAAMDEAFAAGPAPAGISAEAHAAALAWTPPRFKPFDAAGSEHAADDPGRPHTGEPRASGSEAPPPPAVDAGSGPAETSRHGASEDRAATDSPASGTDAVRERIRSKLAELPPDTDSFHVTIGSGGISAEPIHLSGSGNEHDPENTDAGEAELPAFLHGAG